MDKILGFLLGIFVITAVAIPTDLEEWNVFKVNKLN